jgi:hypothetical protein
MLLRKHPLSANHSPRLSFPLQEGRRYINRSGRLQASNDIEAVDVDGLVWFKSGVPLGLTANCATPWPALTCHPAICALWALCCKETGRCAAGIHRLSPNHAAAFGPAASLHPSATGLAVVIPPSSTLRRSSTQVSVSYDSSFPLLIRRGALV